MIETEEIFDAIRRGYTELQSSTPSEIMDYFANVNTESMGGHISNIKGILFEQEVVQALNEQGMTATMFEATNHPATDIAIWDNGEIVGELQLKATDSVAYIDSTLELNPDIPIITTNEVAMNFTDSDMVINSGIDNSVLEEAVSSTLISDTATDIATETSAEFAGEVSAEVLNDVASEGLADMVADTISAIPISPLGVVGLLFGFFC